MLKKIFCKNKAGETLIETIIAISLITLAISASVTLIVTTLKANEISKERIVAINLGREGIEAMRAIRDTNWLIYSNNRRICWNHNPNEGKCEDITPPLGVTDNPMEEGYYRIDLSPDYTFTLDNDGANNWKNNTLYLEDGVHTHRSNPPNEKTIFARRVYIAYLDDDAETSNDPGNTGDVYTPESNNRMEVTSEVRYIVSGRVQTIRFVTHLSDHLGRQGHDE